MRSASRGSRWTTRGGLLVAAAILLLSGCAYFNTFYNAKSNFKKAEKERAASPLSGAEYYQKCIDKCLLLMRYYPKSKYVDDALFLIGMSRLHRKEYVQARASFEELVERYPKSEYVARGWYHMGLASLRQGDSAGAAQAFEKLAEQFPGSRLNIEAVFRSAEAQLDAQDFERAREELRAFIAAHPESELAAEAQLRLARTYYDEKRNAEARQEYEQVLRRKNTAEVRYEAELNSALSLRAMAEEILANALLQRASRMGRGARRAMSAPPPGVSSQPRPPTPPGAPPGAGLPPGMGMPPGTGMASGEEEPEFPPGAETPYPPDLEPEARDAAEAASPPPEERPRPEAEPERQAPGDRDTAAGAPADTIPTEVPGTGDSLEIAPLSAEDEARLAEAETRLDDVAKTLAGLRKPAARLGHQLDLDIDIAVTRALRGEPSEAIDDLDQIARLQPRTEFAARARYEIGEIYRRLGALDKARVSYDDVRKERGDAVVSDRAAKKSSAIVARTAAEERLRDAPAVLRRWQAVRRADSLAALAGKEATLPPSTGTEADTLLHAASDSLGQRIQAQADFETLAAEQLRLAEIDLLDLDQPLAALREFECLLRDFAGSLQEPRAAFAIAWIYEHRLRDRERAHQAYETVARLHAETPQGREARAILERWTQ